MTDGNKLHLILSPHFDDAVLSLGGFIAENKSDTLVVTILGGKPGVVKYTQWDKRCGFKDSDDANTQRMAEDINALTLLGLSDNQIKKLDYLEQQYRLSYKKELWLGLRYLLMNKIVKKILKICSSFREKEISIYAPLFNYNNDHWLVREVLLSVRRRLKKYSVRFFIYQDMPYSYRFMNETGTHSFNEIENYLQSLLPKVVLKPTPIFISEKAFSTKIAALKCYASQLAPLAKIYNKPVIELVESFSKEQANQLGYAGYVEVVYELKTL